MRREAELQRQHERLEKFRSVPPLHVHCEDDELFSILEGEATFWVGDDPIPAPAGTIVSMLGA